MREPSAPAALDREHGLAPGVDPDARTIPAARPAFHARRLGDLTRDVDAAAATGVDHAHVVLVIAARAAHLDRRIPARTRTPRIARPRSRRRLRRTAGPAALHAEHAFAARIDPDAGAVPAPGAAFDASRLGDLLHEAHAAAAAGVDLAHVVVVAAARAAHVDVAVPAGTRPPLAAVLRGGRGVDERGDRRCILRGGDAGGARTKRGGGKDADRFDHESPRMVALVSEAA